MSLLVGESLADDPLKTTQQKMSDVCHHEQALHESGQLALLGCRLLFAPDSFAVTHCNSSDQKFGPVQPFPPACGAWLMWCCCGVRLQHQHHPFGKRVPQKSTMAEAPIRLANHTKHGQLIGNQGNHIFRATRRVHSVRHFTSISVAPAITISLP